MTINSEGLTMSQLAERADLHMQIAELKGKLERAESAVAIGLESISQSLHVLRVETARSNQLAVENAALKETLENVINRDNEPEYHDQGMGCGVEDHRYQRDGYAACSYGWERAMERIYSEVIPDAMPEMPATDIAIADFKARGVDALIELKVKLLESLHPDTHAFGSAAMELRAQINEMQAFAQQLRKGVSHP